MWFLVAKNGDFEGEFTEPRAEVPFAKWADKLRFAARAELARGGFWWSEWETFSKSAGTDERTSEGEGIENFIAFDVVTFGASGEKIRMMICEAEGERVKVVPDNGDPDQPLVIFGEETISEFEIAISATVVLSVED